MSDIEHITPVVTTNTIRKVAQAGDLMADATVDPYLWSDQMKGRLWGVAERAGILNKDKITKLSNEVISILTERKQLGNVDAAYSEMDRLIKESVQKTIDFTHSMYPKAVRPAVDDAKEWLRTRYSLTPNVINGILKDSRTGEMTLTREHWLANVHSRVEKLTHNKNGQHNAHWFSASNVSSFLIHFHARCDERDYPIKDRSTLLNQILGDLATPYNFVGRMADARDRVDVWAKDNPVLGVWFPRDGDKTSEEKKAEPVRNWGALWPALYDLYYLYDIPTPLLADPEIHRLLGTTTLTVFPKEFSNAEIIAKLKNTLDRTYKLRTAKEANMPPATPPAITRVEWDAWKKQYCPDVPIEDILRYLSDSIETEITKFSEWPSTKTLTDASNAVDAGIASDARKMTAPPQPASAPALVTPPAPTSEAVSDVIADPSLSAEKGAVKQPLPENVIDASMRFTFSPATVYPYERGSYIYKGVRWSIQLHMPGALAFAHQMMDELLATGAIAPECFTANQKGPFDPDARHEDIYEIKLTEIKDKPGYALYYLAGEKETEFPIQVYDGTENKTMLEEALRAAGYKLETFKLGGRVKVNISLDYKKGAAIKGSPNGARYNDFTHVEIIQTPAAATA